MKKKARKKKRKAEKGKKKSKKISLKKNKLRVSNEKVKDNSLIKIKSDWQKKAFVNRKQSGKSIRKIDVSIN